MLGVRPAVKRYVLGTQEGGSPSGHQAEGGGPRGEWRRAWDPFLLLPSSSSQGFSRSHNWSIEEKRLTHSHTGKSKAQSENWVPHEGTESWMWECVSVSLSGSLSAPKAFPWLAWGSSWVWRRWNGGSESPKSSGASPRAGPDSPAFHSVQARPLDWQPGGGVVQGIEALERNGRAYCPKPARGPQRPAGLFISAPKQTGHFPGPGVVGNDPSELGVGCCSG